MYSSDEFRDLAIYLRELTDHLGSEAGPSEKAAMEDAYVTSTRWEYRFWEMSYNLEDWSV
jgi:thiaminase/transcriptional activator TenA